MWPNQDQGIIVNKLQKYVSLFIDGLNSYAEVMKVKKMSYQKE